MERLGKRPAGDDSHAKKVSGICPLYGNAMYDMVCVFSGIPASACGKLPLAVQLEEGKCRLMTMGAVMGIEAACLVLGKRYVPSIYWHPSIHDLTHSPTRPSAHSPTRPPAHPPIHVIIMILIFFQVRSNRFGRFAMYHSGNEFPYQRLVDELDLKSFECAKDSHGNNYSTFTINNEKRVSHITRILETFNQENPSKAIMIEAMRGDPPITTFDIRSKYTKHYIILAIREASEKKRKGIDVFYRKWNKEIQRRIDDDEERERYAEDCAVQEVVMQEDPSAFQCSGYQAVGSVSAKSTSRATRLLEIDMIPSSLNPVGSKRSHLSSTKPAGLTGKLSLYIN